MGSRNGSTTPIIVLFFPCNFPDCFIIYERLGKVHNLLLLVEFVFGGR